MFCSYEYHKLKAQLAILEDVAEVYQTSSVPNAIQQIKSRIKHIEQNDWSTTKETNERRP